MTVRTVEMIVIIFGVSVIRSYGASYSEDASAFGTYAETGLNFGSSSISTFTGKYVVDYRSWFLFDLSSIPKPVTSVTLQLELEYQIGPRTQVVDVFDVASTKAELFKGHAENDPVSQAIFADLGSGNVYGTEKFDYQVGQVFDLSLDSQAVFDINNSTDHLFAVGLAARKPLPPEIEQDGGVRFSFDRDQPKIHRLVVTTVPEPQYLPVSMIACIAFHASILRPRRN